MAIEKVREYFRTLGVEDKIRELPVSTATVELAAAANGVSPGEIAKSMTFMVEEKPVMIVLAGDTKIDNQKFKARFHTKAKMLTPEQVHELIGHDVGGVCPFALNEGVTVYLDEALKRFEIVLPAAGSENSAVPLTIAELERFSRCDGWVDVAKLPEV